MAKQQPAWVGFYHKNPIRIFHDKGHEKPYRIEFEGGPEFDPPERERSEKGAKNTALALAQKRVYPHLPITDDLGWRDLREPAG